jgi:sec-independent protein translocase protein TatA
MPELIVIFVVVLLLFGSKRLPELARGLGKGMREFKKAANDIKNELDTSSIRNEIESAERDIKKDIEDSTKI